MTAPPCIAHVGKLGIARCHPSWRVRPLSLRSASPAGVCPPLPLAWQVTPVGAPWAPTKDVRRDPVGVPRLVCGLDDLAQRQSAGIGQAGQCAPGSRVVTHHHVQRHVDELRGVRPEHVFFLGRGRVVQRFHPAQGVGQQQREEPVQVRFPVLVPGLLVIWLLRPQAFAQLALLASSCHCKVFTFQTAVTHKRRLAISLEALDTAASLGHTSVGNLSL